MPLMKRDMYDASKSWPIIVIMALCLVFPKINQAQTVQDSVAMYLKTLQQENVSNPQIQRILTFSEYIAPSYPKESIRLAEKALPLVRKMKNQNLEFELLLLLAQTNSQILKGEQAIGFFRKGYELSLKQSNLMNQYRILNGLGVYFTDQKETDSAMYYYTKAQTIAESLDNQELIAGNLNNMGIIYQDIGDLNAAYKAYSKALQKYQSLQGFEEQQALILNNIGLIFNSLGKNKQSITYHHKAVELSRRKSNPLNLAMSYTNLGSAFSDAGELDSALKYHLLSFEVVEQVSDVYGQARALMNMANVYRKMNQKENALSCYNRSMAICESNGITFGVLLNKVNISEMYADDGKHHQAIKGYREALDLTEQMKLPPIAVEVYKGLYQSLKAIGKFDDAIEMLEMHHHIRDSLETITKETEIMRLETELKTKEQILENEKLQAQVFEKSRRLKNQRIAGLIISLLLIASVVLLLQLIKRRQQLTAQNGLLNKLNDEISVKNAQLEELNQTKDKLFSVVAHDLRAPFNGLLGILSMLTDEFRVFPEYQQRKILQTSYEQAVNTFGLIENLLQWSMNQRGMIEVRPASHDFRAIAEMELDLLKTRYEKKQLIIENQIPEHSQAWVDYNLARIVLRNTINNAIKFTPVGGRITLLGSSHEGHLEITIRDTGIGMDEELVEKLFRLNSNSNRLGTERESGSGLGLVIVKEFVQMLQGNITVESTPGKGTDVILMFPAKATPDHS